MTADHLNTEISQNIADLQHRITAACDRAGRDPKGVTLIAVSKTHPPDRIRPALDAGLTVFGENRVQEAMEKWPALKAAWPKTELHLIGPLQTNKAKDAIATFDALHSLDRPKLAKKIADLGADTGQLPNLFVQVNTGEEEQKAGIAPSQADDFIHQCKEDYGLPVVGLMCIPPAQEEPALHFALLSKIARRNGLENLSMGMSSDFETAIELGATHIRVGTYIFGSRQSTP